MTKKPFPTDAITNELAGASAFFQPQATPVPEQSPEKAAAAPPRAETPLSTTPNQDRLPDDTKQLQQAELPSIRQDVTIDVTTSLLQSVDLKRWREQIEDTETQNSSLRLTSEERYVIEDIISELQRKERIKTSMNEVARLGLLFLIHEFKQNRRMSILYRVKKA
jgi:hypothetical protein